MKSMKQIADMTGVSKMTVYRYIKANNITETSQKNRTLLYDDTSVSAIIKGLSGDSDVSHVTPDDASDFKEEYIIKLESMNEFLKTELDDKNNQIQSLQTILSQQQQLLLYKQQKIQNYLKKIQRLKNGGNGGNKITF